jgi:hypothetical protein
MRLFFIEQKAEMLFIEDVLVLHLVIELMSTSLRATMDNIIQTCFDEIKSFCADKMVPCNTICHCKNINCRQYSFSFWHRFYTNSLFSHGINLDRFSLRWKSKFLFPRPILNSNTRGNPNHWFHHFGSYQKFGTFLFLPPS